MTHRTIQYESYNESVLIIIMTQYESYWSWLMVKKSGVLYIYYYWQEETLFDKIIRKEIPASILYEDDASLAFRDINAQAPTHFLVIPKARIPMLEKATDEDSQLLGHLLTVARKVADQEKLEKGNFEIKIGAVIVKIYVQAIEL